MSLTTDITAYLTSQGVIDGTTWKSYVGDAQKTKDAHDRMVIITLSPGDGPDTHDDSNRLPGFKVRIRGRQHNHDEALTKWQAMYDALQDGETAINADAGVSGTYNLVHSDQSAPIQFPDGKDRPNMTCDFRVTMAT